MSFQGKHHSEKTKKKMREKRKGGKPTLGKKFSKKWKENMRKAHLGKIYKGASRKTKTIEGRWIIWQSKNRCYIFQSRLVMEKKIGRKLLPNEVVHHKDGNVANDRVENLEVMDRGKHAALHRKEQYFTKDKSGRFVKGQKITKKE